MPYLTADLPGVGGVFKRHDEDFVVEELPLYLPCGRGTHTYFVMEKQGLPTPGALRLVARALGVRPNDIGYAGLKDAHGITRQTFSVEHIDPDRIRSLTLARIRILSVDRHTNKLKLGHLAGNRFAIKVRQVTPSPLSRAAAVMAVLTARGVPNYFGPQRFGVRGDNAEIGRAVLQGEYDEALALMLGRPSPSDRSEIFHARALFDAGQLEKASATWPPAFSQQARVCRALSQAGGDSRKAWRAVDHSLRKLYVAAVQSDLFNRVLARRINTIDRLQNGDIAWKHRNGACFHVESAAVEQPRCEAFEISPTGPLFGRRMMEPRGEPAELETEIITASGLARGQLRAPDGTKLDGARRPLRVPITDPRLETGEDERGPYLGLAFALPPGAYATSIIREICEPEEGQSVV